MDKLFIRCSSLHLIMGEPRSKSEILTQTAKTYIEGLIDAEVYGYDNIIYSKEMEKGTTCEQDSIDLINEIKFTDYKKNTVRLYNDFITGECDLVCKDEDRTVIRDVKTSWSKKTFPKTKAQAQKKAKKSGYHIQAAGYMYLWDIDNYIVSYCLVDTPEHLIGYEDFSLHYTEDVPLELRLTEIEYKRDKALEEKIRTKVEQAREYANFYKMQVENRL